jgi:hypothetical protein
MRNLKRFMAATLTIALVALPAFSSPRASYTAPGESVVQQSGTLERGYRTGYSDGYQEGISDSAQPGGAPRVINDGDIPADRGYSPAFGSLEDYRDGYIQGFKIGYDAGFERRPFDSSAPANLSRRNSTINQQTDDNNSSNSSSNSSSSSSTNNGGSTTGGGRVMTGGTVDIPSNTMMRVELLTNLSTEASQRGDRFQARVLEPAEYEGAILDGRVTRVRRPGRVRGTAELQLSFDQIRLTDNRWADIEAQVIEVVDTGGSGVGDVDEEGGVKGKGSTKDNVVKIGAGTALGAIIGAIAGGGKGAAIGAVIGGAIGTGGAISSRGKEIRLPQGQQLRIRTSRETRIQ